MSMQVTKKMTTKTTVTKTTQHGDEPPVTESHTSEKMSIESGSGLFKDTFGKHLSLEGPLEEQMKKIKEEFKIKALEPTGSSTQVIKLDDKNIMDFFNKERNKLNLHFDIGDVKRDSFKIKAVGNKIAVHGEKVIKTKEGETKEEYSRTFELPSPVEATAIKPYVFQDGVLTVELPIPAEHLK